LVIAAGFTPPFFSSSGFFIPVDGAFTPAFFSSSCYLTPTGLGVLEGAITFGAVVLRAAAVFVSVDLSAGFSALFVIKSIRSRPLDATSLNVLTS
jgi:hypothetical protein